MRSILILLFSMLSSQAMAFPLPNSVTAQNIFPYFDLGYNYEGIVALNNCSGSIIRFETSQDSDFAVILTNGHCLDTGFTPPNEFRFNKPSHRSFTVLDPQAKSIGSVTATTLIYSTMTNTDISLYQLKETYSEILTRYNVRPFTLSTTHPATSQTIDIVSGFWRKGYSCSIDQFIYQLKEENWTFADSIKYSQPGCNTIGGTSGSPIILANTRSVIGINNTGNESGERCTMNNPCEVANDGSITYKEGDAYGQETFWIYSCLNLKNEMDLSLAGCQLPH